MAGEPKVASGRLINCTSCGANILIRAQGLSVVAVCDKCQSELDTTDETLRVLTTLKQRQRRAQVIELGGRGRVHGNLYECIGYMERSDDSGVYMWSEYLLFNPARGFRWLTEFDGHWNYTKVTKNPPRNAESYQPSIHYLDKDYHLFHKGHAKVQFVRGEFNWQVKVGERVTVRDYISPPEMLSFEGDEKEAIWSVSTYIEADKIRDGFGIKEAMPPQTGVGPNQPTTLAETSSGILGYFAMFILALFMLQTFFVLTADRAVVFRTEATHDPMDPVKTKVTPPFELKGYRSNLLFDLDTNLNNGWLSVSADLINEETGESLAFEHGAETYTGRDSDGTWREGSRHAELIISSVPAGRYHINYETDSRSGPSWMQANSMNPMSYGLTVWRNVPTWSNLLWAMGVLTIFPVFAWWRSRSFEVNRWSTSDFSPYFSEDEDD